MQIETAIDLMNHSMQHANGTIAAALHEKGLLLGGQLIVDKFADRISDMEHFSVAAKIAA